MRKQPPPSKPSALARAVTYVAFAGLMAAPLLLRATPKSAAAGSDALKRYGFYLQNVTQEIGIDFVHRAPTLDPKLAHIMPTVASMGAAVSAVDYDRDGWVDLYVTDSAEDSPNRLYRNDGKGKFVDVAPAVGLADVNRREDGVSMGAVWGDYDNDGWDDVFLYKWGKPELFRSEGGKKFTRVTDGSGLPAWVNANSATWTDYDRDGLLDLFIGGYFPEKINLWKLENTRMMPESWEYAKNGGRKYLLRNLGGGRFEDVTAKTGIESRRWALAVACADLRGTGYPDIFVANDYGVAELYANKQGKRFEQIGDRAGVGERPKSGMNVCFGDIFNQGRFAVYVTNITAPGVLVQGNNLWVPREDATGDRLAYDNMANSTGVEDGGWSFGAQFGDLDNSGTQDLFLTNGYVSDHPTDNYWYYMAQIAASNERIIGDAKNWPPMKNLSLSGYEQKKLWLNDGVGKFTDVSQAVGVTEKHDGRAVVLADLWNRGVLDVIVAHQKGPLLVYKNTVAPERQWIQFELEGTKSNRNAYGAQLRLFWNGQQQLQEVTAASGFCAQNQRRLHFGLGPNPRIEKAVIRWPSGHTQTIERPESGKLHTIKE